MSGMIRRRERIRGGPKVPIREEVTAEEMLIAEAELTTENHAEDYRDLFAANMMMWHEHDGKRVSAKEAYKLGRETGADRDSFVKGYAFSIKVLAKIEDRLVAILNDEFHDDEKAMREFIEKRHQIGTAGSSSVPKSLADELVRRVLEEVEVTIPATEIPTPAT